MKLDPLMVMMEFEDGMSFNYQTKSTWNNFIPHMTFNLTRDFSITLRFNIFQKRLELDFFNRNGSGINTLELFKFLEKKGTMRAYNNTAHNSHYSFKYSDRNCERIANILLSIFTEFLPAKRGELVANTI